MKMRFLSIPLSVRRSAARLKIVAGSTVCLCLFVPSAVHAYIGPGAGLTAIATVAALVGAVLLGIVGFVWYPLKRRFGRKKSDADSPVEIEDTSAARSPGAAENDDPPQ